MDIPLRIGLQVGQQCRQIVARSRQIIVQLRVVEQFANRTCLIVGGSQHRIQMLDRLLHLPDKVRFDKLRREGVQVVHYGIDMLGIVTQTLRKEVERRDRLLQMHLLLAQNLVRTGRDAVNIGYDTAQTTRIVVQQAVYAVERSGKAAHNLGDLLLEEFELRARHVDNIHTHLRRERTAVLDILGR